ncbi:adenylate cyclase [Synechococcus sp. KORDI-52]|uniref:CYTH domain-containing protein n=1 Tax=Synechococcus sp. KORDI-52 TaxID=585425 RepID=UPI0004E08CCC|nr:CYTH domain-containing protein [Synechococcus sp. KORDI-52]AII48330.1 adenylate cyclase [Synechococcus sp. KORDI-52]
MALEIERRFLVRSDAWRSCAGPAQALRQGYLAASAEGVTVRMRLRGTDQAWLTLKAAADAAGLVRHEFEYPIPVADAEALWELAPHRLEKVRYVLDHPGGDWVVDCFHGGNAPLLLAEVELASAQVDLLIPAWCGEEITGQSRWSNAVLAQHPVQSWPEQERRRWDLV